MLNVNVLKITGQEGVTFAITGTVSRSGFRVIADRYTHRGIRCWDWTYDEAEAHRWAEENEVEVEIFDLEDDD